MSTLAKASSRAASVPGQAGSQSVAIDAPGLQHALHVAVLARAADVVHHLRLAVFHDGRTDPGRDGVERLVPGAALPAPLAAPAGPLERVEDAVRVVDLVERGRPLGAGAAAAAGMDRVALELLHLQGVFVDVGEQPAGRLAVEAGGRDQHVATGDARGPGPAVILHPVVPSLRRRIIDELPRGAGARRKRRGREAITRALPALCLLPAMIACHGYRSFVDVIGRRRLVGRAAPPRW